jgi:hypothetical protein
VTSGRLAESRRGVLYPYVIPGTMYPDWMASIIIASAGSYVGPIVVGMPGGGCIDSTSLRGRVAAKPTFADPNGKSFCGASPLTLFRRQESFYGP